MADHDQPAGRSLELIQQFQGGNIAALDELMTRYYSRVYHIVCVRAGPAVLRVKDPDDLVQQTFLTALAKFGDFTVCSESSLINWLSKIATRHILHGSREAHRIPRSLHERIRRQCDSGSICTDPSASLPMPQDLAIDTERRNALYACIHKMSDPHRESLTLRFFAGCSWSEVATELSMTPEAARKTATRAMVELVKCLKAHGHS